MDFIEHLFERFLNEIKGCHLSTLNIGRTCLYSGTSASEQRLNASGPARYRRKKNRVGARQKPKVSLGRSRTRKKAIPLPSSTDLEREAVSINNPTPKRSLDLAQKIIEMLFERDPKWSNMPFPPNSSQMEKLAEDADYVLRAANSHFQRRVHAYQLFTPRGPFMRVRDIESRFKELGWKKGKSHNTLRPLIRRLLAQAEREVAARAEAFAGLLTEHSPSSGTTLTPGRLSIGEFLDKLELGVIHLLDDLGIAGVVKDPDALRRSVVASLVKQIEMQIDRSNPQTMAEDPTASLAVTRFMHYVCGADTVEDFNAQDEHSVRPYELFLFARQQKLFERDLWISVDQLDDGADQELQKSAGNSLSILESHGGLDEAIEAWMEINDPQGIEPMDAKFP